MITVEFYRFCPEIVAQNIENGPVIMKASEVDTSKHLPLCIFTVTYHAVSFYYGNDCPYLKARKMVRQWLKDHYGMCKIYVDNRDGVTGCEDTICISNRKKLVKDFLAMGAEVHIK